MAHDHEHPESPNSQRIVSRFVFFGFVAVAAYFLITEHRAHLFGWLPFLLFAACPLMHVFHHRGHGGDHQEGDSPRSPPGSEPPPNTPSGGHRH
jgi:hypothetical protein